MGNAGAGEELGKLVCSCHIGGCRLPEGSLGEPREGRRGLAREGTVSRESMATRLPNLRHSLCASVFFYSFEVVFVFADYERSSNSL